MSDYKFRRATDRLEFGELLARMEALLDPETDFETMVRPLLENLQETTGVESAFITRIDWDAQTQEVLHSVNADESWVWPEDVAVDWSDTMCRTVFMSGRESTEDAAGEFPDSFLATGMGLKTYVSIHLRTDSDHILGTLCAASRSAVPIDDERQRVFRLVARIVAMRMERNQRLAREKSWSRQEKVIAARMQVLAPKAGPAGQPVADRRRLQRLAYGEQAAAPLLLAVDPLTGLDNRRGFAARWEEFLVGAARTNHPVAVAVLDVDGFREVNAGNGTRAGNDVLRAVARVLRRLVRSDDILARMGADDFAVVMPDADLAEALRRVKEVMAELTATILGTYPGPPTLSIGISCSFETRLDDLVEAAYAAAARASSNGGGQVDAWRGELPAELRPESA